MKHSCVTAACLTVLAIASPAIADMPSSSILGAIRSNWSEANFKATINDGSADRFRIGDQLSFHFSSDRAAYLTLIHVDSRGVMTVLLPSRLDNRIPAGGALSFPPSTERFFLQAEPPAGLQSLFAFATPEPVDLGALRGSKNAVATVLEDNEAITTAQNVASRLRQQGRMVAALRLDHRILAPSSASAEEILEQFDSQRKRGIRRPKVDAHINFEYNSCELTGQAKAALDEFAKALHADALANRSFQLGGHADARGGDQYNLDLSRERAESARKYLVATGKLPADRLRSKGFGKSRPLDPADNEEAYKVNRRVEFEILN